MRFSITRASTGFRARADTPPVEGAIKGPRNSEHDDDWFVEINTLEELCSLNEKAGADLIFSRGAGGEGSLWIYDDYME